MILAKINALHFSMYYINHIETDYNLQMEETNIEHLIMISEHKNNLSQESCQIKEDQT